MKLSEAIREGAKKRPQTFDSFFSWDYDTDEGDRVCIGSCALGAAYEACVGSVSNYFPEQGVFDAISACVGIDLDQPIGPANMALWREITGRNDEDRHTREEIADWLEAEGL